MNSIITCGDCGGNGWGPMLRDKVWNRLGPIQETPWRRIDQPSLPRKGKFLCEPCIVKRLGHPIRSLELRDCPMNASHPAYIPHGKRHD